MTVIVSEQVSAESERDPPIPADRTPEVLGGMDDLQLLAIVGSEPRGSERRAAACAVLVGRYRGMVWSCAQRYCGSPEPAEDLLQAGYVGLMKAINNFDPTFGRSLAAYAQPLRPRLLGPPDCQTGGITEPGNRPGRSSVVADMCFAGQ